MICTLRLALLIIREPGWYLRLMNFLFLFFILVSSQPACNTSSFRQHGPLICDGFRDCENGRDEQNCTQSEGGSSVPCCSSYETLLNQDKNTSEGSGVRAINLCQFLWNFSSFSTESPCLGNPFSPKGTNRDSWSL